MDLCARMLLQLTFRSVDDWEECRRAMITGIQVRADHSLVLQAYEQAVASIGSIDYELLSRASRLKAILCRVQQFHVFSWT